jgi:kinetochore protein Nuf2
MAYNNRMSMAGSQQHHNRGRKKEDDNDALMRLVSMAFDLEAGV